MLAEFRTLAGRRLLLTTGHGRLPRSTAGGRPRNSVGGREGGWKERVIDENDGCPDDPPVMWRPWSRRNANRRDINCFLVACVDRSDRPGTDAGPRLTAGQMYSSVVEEAGASSEMFSAAAATDTASRG